MKASKKRATNKIAFQGGVYSLAISAVVLAIMIVVNVLVSALPTSLTKFDISSTQLYSITSNTKVVVNALEEDVTIYWIVQADQEDDVIENLLNKYENLSDHIQVVKKNPDEYPTFAEQYTDETVANNSLIVECGDKYRYIAYTDIYIYETNYTTGSSSVSEFDGEGALTSAIDYVTSDDQPIIYVLEGHGESDLPDTVADQITKENMETESLSLVKEGEVPEDADAIIIYSPTSDISEEETEILAEYVSNGGKLFVAAGPVEDGTLTNLNSLLETYNVTVNDGVVIEAETDGYAFGYPYILLPEIASSDITDALIEENYNVIIPIANGLTIGEDSSNGTVTSILSTSESSYLKADGYAISTYDYEEGDTYGPYSVGVSIEDNSGGQIIWISSSAFLDDTYNSYSSGANGDLTMNALSSLVGETEAMAIRSKSFAYNYLTISESTSALLKVLMIGVFPLAYLAIGIIVVVRRRSKQNG